MQIISDAFAAALRRYYRNYPDAMRVTAREFARVRFVLDSEQCRDRAEQLVKDGIASPRRLLREAVRHAYILIIEEHLKHNKYAR